MTTLNQRRKTMKGKIVIIFVLAMMFLMSGTVHAGNLVIKGSTTVLPIAQKVAEAYMKENPDVKISISGGGSGNGIKALIDGTTDIADSSRFIKDKEIALADRPHLFRSKEPELQGEIHLTRLKEQVLDHAVLGIA